MNLENNIKDTISKKLEDGTIERIIEEQLEKGVVNALDNLFRSYGDVTKVIEEKVKSVMIPYLEDYDYSEYIIKLDSVLVDVLKNSALENKNILTNFKNLIAIKEEQKTIKVTELYKKWMKYVEKNIDTYGLEVNCDDEPHYEYVEIMLNVEYGNDRDWSSFKHATLIFECEHDEKMNFSINLSKWNESKKETWELEYKTTHDINSLRYLNEFEVFLMRLNQRDVRVEIDTEYERDDIIPDEEPEVSFN